MSKDSNRDNEFIGKEVDMFNRFNVVVLIMAAIADLAIFLYTAEVYGDTYILIGCIIVLGFIYISARRLISKKDGVVYINDYNGDCYVQFDTSNRHNILVDNCAMLDVVHYIPSPFK